VVVSHISLLINTVLLRANGSHFIHYSPTDSDRWHAYCHAISHAPYPYTDRNAMMPATRKATTHMHLAYPIINAMPPAIH